MGSRKALGLVLAVVILSIGGGAAVGPVLSRSLGFGVGAVGSQAIQFGEPQVLSADGAESVLPGGYAMTNSDHTGLIVGTGLPAGSSFRVRVPITNLANDPVQLKLRVSGLPLGGASAQIQGGDLALYPAMRKSDANLARLYYGGRASLEDGGGGPASGNVFALFDGARDPYSGSVTIHDGQAVIRDLGPLPPTSPHRGVDRIALHWVTSDPRVAYVSFNAYAMSQEDAGFSRVVRAQAVPAGDFAGETSEGFSTDSRQIWKIVIYTYDRNRRELPDGAIDLTEVELGSAYDVGVIGCIAPVTVVSTFTASLDRPACHQDRPVIGESRVDTYYMTKTGLHIAEGSGPLPDDAVGLWQITVAPQSGPEFNVVTGTLDLRQTASAASVAVSSPFSSSIGDGVWHISLQGGQTGTLTIDVALPATLPPGFSGLTFRLLPMY